MSNLNTELMTALLKNESIDEVFRSHLEAAMNDLLKIELTQFLGYEKSSILGYNTGNSRNGFYERDLDYSPATMSNISKAVADQVENFHKRQLSERYAVIFMDATYLNVRRGVMLSNDSFRKQSISNAGFIFHVRLPDTFAIRIVKRSSVI